MAATTGAKTAPQDETAELKAEIAKLRKEISDLGRHVSEVGNLSAKTARKTASSKAEELREQGEAAFEDLRESALDYEKQLTDNVREKPITSLAIAAAVGYFFALIARR